MENLYLPFEEIFLGNPVYRCGQGYDPEIHKQVGVVAKNEKEAKEKIIDYCFKINPRTSKQVWDVWNMKLAKKSEGISLEKTIETLQNAGIDFIGIDLK